MAAHMLLSIEQLEASENRFKAIQHQPAAAAMEMIGEESLLSGVPSEVLAGSMPEAEDELKIRKNMLASLATEPLDFAFERAIGKNDSVYSNFIELVLNAKRKVGRIACKKGSKVFGYATGFMVSERLMLTNWHVFKTIDAVVDSELQFSYELDERGDPKGYTAFRFQADQFFHSDQALDYCFIAVNPVDITGKTKLTDMGYLYLDPGLGKLGAEGDESLNLIHHPDGDFKQLSIRENRFVKRTPTTIWYESDTSQGSSGSPVFNDQWQVVALHHMGVGKKNDKNQYIDKDGNVIEPVNGKINESKIVWIANEGIRVSSIVKDVFLKFPGNSILETINVPPPSEKTMVAAVHVPASAPMPMPMPMPAPIPAPLPQPFKINPFTEIDHNIVSNNNNNSTSDINITIPASLVAASGEINIHINNGDALAAPKQEEHATVDGSFEEIKKLEAEMDLSDCKGYLANFLGTNIALPTPLTKLKKFIAKVNGTDSMVLKYHHYSVLHHTVRMMPVISAINVDGDLKKRQDESKRKDNWLRDNRISYDVQLDDPFYRNSGFDKGHMSRREDANWGATPELAKLYADTTCMHTNACPQVGALNQSMQKGLWGKLEMVVLEEGAIKEKKKTNKISVFNGPIFKEDDPVFRGIQIPMAFYKIVLWLTDAGKVKATAFKLSQEELVGDIDLEELNLDQNIEFKEYQVRIKSLQTETGLDFSGIIPFDTYSRNGAHEIATTETKLRSHINSNKK